MEFCEVNRGMLAVPNPIYWTLRQDEDKKTVAKNICNCMTVWGSIDSRNTG
jgi:hypothetical protein